MANSTTFALTLQVFGLWSLVISIPTTERPARQIVGSLNRQLTNDQRPAANDSLLIRFIGNEALEITDGQTTLLTDFPYQSGAFGYMKYRPETVNPRGNVISLITHGHRDHFDAELFRARSWRVIGPRAVTATLPSERVIPLDSVIDLGALRITPLATPHASIEHYSYLVTWNGLSLYLSGDTDDPATVLAQRSLDLAVVSPWIWQAARRSGRSINARRVAIYHHRLDEKVDDCPGCWIPMPDERLRLEAAAR